MENKERKKPENGRERVLVPVRRHETTQKEEHSEEQNKARAWKMPRRWHV